MILENEIKRKLRRATTENIKTLLLFLESETVVTYDQIAKTTGLDKEKDSGRAVGGILSSLSRNKISNEPLIISVGPERGTRRLLWRLNNKAMIDSKSRESLKKIVLTIIDERSQYVQ